VAPCAGSSATQRVDAAGLRRPPVVLVYPFAVDPEDVVVDTFGPSFATGEGTVSERVQSGRRIARDLAHEIVKALDARGIRAEAAGASSEPPLYAALVKGQFVSVSEGDQMLRFTIGFGSGTESLRANLQVYQVTPSGLQRLVAGSGEARGDRMPGMVVPLGAAGVAGRAAPIVIGGGFNVVSELKGPLGNRIRDLAAQFAERALEYYVERGWL
jgi:hypothetical protein